MALTTYTELKSSIANWLNRDDLTTEIAGDFIALAESDFNAKLRIRQMEQVDTITINAETVTVPTAFIGVRSFYILSGSTKYHLSYITPANLISIKGGSTSGLPRTYTIESDSGIESFRFAPSPDTTYTGYLQYLRILLLCLIVIPLTISLLTILLFICMVVFIMHLILSVEWIPTKRNNG